MYNRHAFRWMIWVVLLSGTTAASQGVAEMPAGPVRAHTLAQPAQPAQVPVTAKRADPHVLAAFLVMFIPWNEPTPTPAVPNGPGPGNGQNGGNGGNGQNTGGNGQNTGGNGQNSGGNGQNSGGNGNNSGGKGSDPGGNGSDPGGKGSDPGGPLLGGGDPQSNPEPASLITTLLGAGLLGLAGLRRRRWLLA